MIRRVLAIAINTFRETFRDRILWSALVVALVIIAFSLFVGSISLGQEARMVVDFGVAAIYVLQIFIAIFIGSMLIYKEMERKTFYLIIPKPLRREEIIAGKCIGLSATVLTVTALSTLALFTVLFVEGVHGFYLPILLSIAYTTAESVLLILLSILFSGLTSPILSAVYTTAFYLIGHSSETLRAIIAATDSTFTKGVLQTAYYILPNLEKFNIRNEIVYGTHPDVRSIALVAIYFVCYAIFLFLLARAMLERKEF